MDIRFILVLGISLGIVLPITWYGIHVIDQKDKIKGNSGAALLLQKNRRSPLDTAYLMLNSMPITRNYLKKISLRYELLCPMEPKELARKTMKAASVSFSICLAVIFFIFLLRPNILNAITASILVVIINSEVINYRFHRAEISLLEQLVAFLSNVRHHYHMNRMVDDAILYSLDGASREMKAHGLKLFEVVTSNNLKEDVQRYNVSTHNKYLKMFLSLCTSVLDYSDKKIHGQLLFTSNLENLKREINIEVLKLKKLQYLFSGTVFVTCAVCIPLDAIQKFGLSILPGLESFYKGRGGIVFVTVIYATVIIVYILNSKLKETKRVTVSNYYYLKKLEDIPLVKRALNNYTDKNYGKVQLLKETLVRIGENITPRQLLLKRLLISFLTLLSTILLCFFIHANIRYQNINKVNNLEQIMETSYHYDPSAVEELLCRYLNQYKKKQVTEEQLLQCIQAENLFYQTTINQRLAQEVIRRITNYQNEYFRWYELLICLSLSLISYYLPYWMILYKKKILGLLMEDEVNQFNSIIYMMMYIDYMTVKDLLEQLELFALVFKQSLQECINDYNSGDIEALLRLKEKEKFPPFQRLVDNFIRCDAIPMEKAFDEIASDRENYHDRRKQENEISIQKRADIAKTISWIPAVFVTIYLLFPIFAASLKELEGFRESLSMLGF